MISDRIIGLHSVLLPLFKRLLSNKPPCLGFHSIKHTPRASQIIRHTSGVQVYFSWVNQSLTHKNPPKVKIFPGGGTLGNYWWGVRPDSPNLDPILDKKMYFFIPLFRPGLWNPHPFSDLASNKIISSLLWLEQEQKRFHVLMYLFLSTPVELKRWTRSCTPTSSLENHTRFQTRMGKVYTRFQTKTAQEPYPLGRHIHIRLI